MTLSGSTCYERMRLIEVSWAVTSSGIMGKRDGEEDGECPLLQIHQSGQGGCFQLGYIENARRGWITTTEVSARGFLLGWFDPEVMGSPCDAVLCYRFPQTKTSKKRVQMMEKFQLLGACYFGTNWSVIQGVSYGGLGTDVMSCPCDAGLCYRFSETHIVLRKRLHMLDKFQLLGAYQIA